MSVSRSVLVVAFPDVEATMVEHAAMVARVLDPDELRIVQAEPAHTVETEEAMASRLLAVAPAPLAEWHRQGRLTTAAIHGDALDAVLAGVQAVGADLLLVPGEPAAKGRRTLARRLAMHAPCSVWMVPQGAAASLTRILVPMDFSTRSSDALGVATAIARAAGEASITALHVRLDASFSAPAEQDELLTGREQHAFGLVLARVDLHGMNVDTAVEGGRDAARTIVRVGQERSVGLIVMGTRGRTRASALLLGSETEHVLLASDVPVLAVKHFGASLRLREALADPRVRRRTGPAFS